jgi:hypothetical protein
MKQNEEKPRRSTGLAQDNDGNYGYLDNGKPNLAPTAGYENTKPVQYSDETDEQYQIRLSDWEVRYAHAQDIEDGGASYESQKKALDAKYDADMAMLDMQMKK